ncbi:hypothetical protein [Wolbachia endosymbiont of Oedothorax gibbosus]|nr:hypothetical protein [Wolbachia endosymbiont of Oedothorax gibbosus]
MRDYVISNLEAIKQEFWDEHIVDSIPETEKEEDNRLLSKLRERE